MYRSIFARKFKISNEARDWKLLSIAVAAMVIVHWWRRRYRKIQGETAQHKLNASNINIALSVLFLAALAQRE